MQEKAVSNARSTPLSNRFRQLLGRNLLWTLLPVVVLLSACDISTGDEGIDSRTATLNESSSIVQNPQNNQLSTSQKRLLVLINAARSQTQTCGEFGAMPAVQKLSWNFLLESSASNTVDDMASGDYFAHINPLTLENGAARISAVGYAYQRWGENLDAGYATPETAMNALLESDTHCRILMRPYWKEVAWFRRDTPEHGTYNVLGTQHFGREQ